MTEPRTEPLERIRAEAAWLLAPELATCVVGSAARREACRRAGLEHDAVPDLDLAWSLDVTRGEALLREHDVFVATTDANRARGTLALRLGGERVEITSFRDDPREVELDARIRGDLARRDMTVGAIAWWLERDAIVDPFDGLEHWRTGRVVPVGPVNDRIAEHPVRWLRYYRKAHEWGFELDRAIRKASCDFTLLDRIPVEAVGAELRAILTRCDSPGTCLLELHEVGVLAHVAPELAPQFDGRAAGPVRHHPEVSQALHLVMVLDWAVERTRGLPPDDAYAVRFAALCHDLGKNETPSDDLPSHRGHEHGGVPIIDALCRRLPGLADGPTKRLATQVAKLHLIARGMRDLRNGTLARMYEDYFRPKTFRRDLFAMAVAADVGGRLGREQEGHEVEARILTDIDWVCSRCERVDAAALREEHADTERFRAALHEARAKSIGRRS